jgi:crotonobetaine/carnitine-CoA ligase
VSTLSGLLRRNPAPPHGWPDFAERSVPGILARSCRAFPDKVALRDVDSVLTYDQLWDKVQRRSMGLAGLGIGPGDRVLLMLDNHVDYVLSWFAVSSLRAVQVPVNTAYLGQLLQSVIDRAGARVAILDAKYLDCLASLDTPLRHLESVVVRGEPEAWPGSLGPKLTRFEQLDSGNHLPSPPLVRPWDINTLMLTSGTTGPSRLVSVPHGLTYSDCDPEWFPGAGSEDTVFVSLPLFHVSGQGAVYNGLVVGATVVVADRFHSSMFWQQAGAFGATFAPILGVMPNYLMNRPASSADKGHTVKRIRMAPVIAALDQFCERFGVEVGSAYGMTEISNPIIAPFGRAKPGACGWLRDDFEVRIVDEHDQDVAPGQVGELVVRPRLPWSVSNGYLGDDDATVVGWRNLWIHTGDSFRADDAGEYYFVDRLKDAIRRRGENISSFEVEQAVNSHPDVDECAVVGLRGQDGDEEVHAVVVPRSGGTLEPEDLVDYLSTRLPSFMVPRFVTIAGELPKTPSGKIRKQALKEEGLGDRSWSSPGSSTPPTVGRAELASKT